MLLSRPWSNDLHSPLVAGLPRGNCMRCLLALTFLVMGWGPAAATIDPDADQLGVYFDLEADENCLTVVPSLPFFAYVTITNPSAAEIHGLEFGYHLEVPEGSEGLLFRLANFCPGECFDWNNTDPLDGDYVVGLASPIPGAGADVIFITWQFMLLAPMTIDFYLGPAVVQSLPDGLPAYEIGGSILPLGVSSGDVNLPVASVNGDCRAVAVTDASWGHVKSLYR
jgi:hypothetical protein